MASHFPKLLRYINSLPWDEPGSEDPIYGIAKKVVEELSQDRCKSSNLPGTKTKENATFVFMVQKEIDFLAHQKISMLDFIHKSAEQVRNFEAGNCREKAFLCVKKLFDEFEFNEISSYESTPRIDIVYCDGDEGHFFLILNDEWVVDPWAQFLYPSALLSQIIAADEESDVYDGPLTSYFTIMPNWACFSYRKGMAIYDNDSTQDTIKYAPKKIIAPRAEAQEQIKATDAAEQLSEKHAIFQPSKRARIAKQDSSELSLPSPQQESFNSYKP
jgi:hypothetical protein